MTEPSGALSPHDRLRPPVRITPAAVQPTLEAYLEHQERRSREAEPGAWQRVLHSLRRRWRWALAVFLAVAALGSWWSFRTVPTYEAQTTLRIDPPQTPGVRQDPNPFFYSNPVETEVQILRSRSLAAEVARELALNVRVVEPKIRRSSALASAAVVGPVEPGTYEIRRHGQGWEAAREGRSLTRAASGQPLRFAGVEVTPAPGAPSLLHLSVVRPEDAAGVVMGGLSVTIPVDYSNIVRVSYRTSDPVLAQAVPNELAAEFVSRTLSTTKREARSTREFLQEQLNQLAAELQRSEAELQAFQQDAGVVSLPTEAEQGIVAYTQFESERNRYVAERRALDQLLAGRARTPPEPEGAELPPLVDNETIQTLRGQITDLEGKKALLLAEKTPAHPDVAALEQQIVRTQSRLKQAVSDYGDALDSRIRALDRTLGGFDEKFRTLPEKEIRLAQLMRARKVAEDLYTDLQIKLKEAQIVEAVEASSIQIVDPAVLPSSPVSPNRRLDLLLTAVVALTLGSAAAVARESVDPTLRSRAHVERELQLPLVGAIPTVRTNGRGRLPRLTGRLQLQPRNGFGARDPRLLSEIPPYSPPAEAFRSLRTNLLFLHPAGSVDGRVLLITSPGPGEGKTLIAASLAIAFAQQGRRTALVDADLRRGVQHLRFNQAPRPGLAEFLLDRASAEEVQHPTGIDNLVLVPRGSAPPLPSELLGSERLDAVLAALRRSADFVVVDAPPVLPVADAKVVANRCDDVLLVVRAGSTNRAAAAESLAVLAAATDAPVRCVLNSVRFEDLYGQRYYRQYYEGYYAGVPTEENPA
jgi:tyrosine-protein kinase Etk/Wzc